MADIFTKKKRSAVMALIKSRGNRRTELRLIELMKGSQITGWRRGSKLFGRPDFVFRTQKLAVFVDGCFWHGCPRHGTQPKQNAVFWRRKILRNMARDRIVNRTLRARDWTVLRIWEHELSQRSSSRPIARLRRRL